MDVVAFAGFAAVRLVVSPLGVRNAIALGAAGLLIAPVILFLSPMRSLVALPNAHDDRQPLLR